MKVDMSKCIRCQKCVKACPYSNIHYDQEKDKFTFGNKCLLCTACSFGCPETAISIGLLNGWRVNGDYQIKKTAADPNIEYPYFTEENLKGIKRWAYLGYYKRVNDYLKNFDCKDENDKQAAKPERSKSAGKKISKSGIF